jgi:hypothetical protein
MRGLAKAPADRFPNVLAFAEALRAAVTGKGTQAHLVESIDTPVAALTLEPHWEEVVTDERSHTQVLPGRETRRLLRSVRSRTAIALRGLVLLLALAGATAFLWLSPATHAHAERALHRASGQLHAAIDQVASSARIKLNARR